jgi:hypothetical protein
MILHFLLVYYTRLNRLSVFEVFRPRNHPLISMLLGWKVHFKITLDTILIIQSQNRIKFILICFFIRFYTINKTLLSFEERELLELSPNKISLLYFISDCKPWSSADKSWNHTRIIPFSNKCFYSMLILQRSLHINLVCIINFPYQITIVISRIRDLKLFSKSFRL